MHSIRTIPFVDMAGFISGSWKTKVMIADQFGKAMQEIGFVAVSRAGIQTKTVDKAYTAAIRYFDLPEKEKLKQRSVDGFRGYVPFGQEHAKNSIHGDLKEFYHTTGPTQPEELWPALDGFKEPILDLYHELSGCLSSCIEAVTIYLGYRKPHESNLLRRPLEAAGGLMRLLHYPPIDHINSAGPMRSAPHEDIGVMTVIPRATEAGLQVMERNGEWIDIEVPSDAAIINAGDTLQYITGGQIPSTTHRVVNKHQRRYSIPFFGNFPLEFPLKILDTCKNDKPAPVITYGDFLNNRYKAIGIRGGV